MTGWSSGRSPTIPFSYWLVVAASKSAGNLFSNGFAIVNFDLRANIGRISSYSDGLSWKWMGNSLVYAVGGGALSTVISMMTGYALAKLDFRGKKVLIAAIPRSGSPWPGFTPGRHPERTAGSGADRQRR